MERGPRWASFLPELGSVLSFSPCRHGPPWIAVLLLLAAAIALKHCLQSSSCLLNQDLLFHLACDELTSLDRLKCATIRFCAS